MSTIIRFMPGFIGAAAAFVALKALIFFGVATLQVEIMVFLVVYFVVTLLADKAMRAYRTSER
jgi:membrane protein implicated in regulation of membrane protease activity